VNKLSACCVASVLLLTQSACMKYDLSKNALLTRPHYPTLATHFASDKPKAISTPFVDAKTTVPSAQITVGAVVAATGTHMFEGRAVRAGYEFWAHWVNNHGGILIGKTHYRVNLIERDDESTAGLTSQLTERLINEEQVQFILGPYGSPETLAGAAVAERKGVPFVTGTGASEKIFEQGYHHVFGVMTPAREYFRSTLDLSLRQHPSFKTVAIVSANDTFSLEARQGALQHAHDLGMKVIISDVYRAGTMDYRPLAAKFAKAKPDVILNAAHTQESIAFTRSLFDAGVEPKIHAEAVGPEMPAFSKLLGSLSDDTWSPAQWSPNLPSAGSSGYFPATAPQYARAFHAFAKMPANTEAASASAAGLALELAITQAQSTNPKRVTASLHNLHVQSYYGPIFFDIRGINAMKPMALNQLESGRLYLIAPKSVSTSDPIYPARPWRAR
jgi:branched-chain amino acid transport system substrate-binding protein